MKNYEQTLLELAQADERIIVMTAENRAAIRNLPNLLPGRFIDTGITEQTIGYVYTYLGAISLVMRGLVLGPAVARWSEVRVLRLGLTTLGLGFALLPFVPGRGAAYWGLGLSTNSQGGQYFLLHDGRAKSIEEAILLHAGEGQQSKERFSTT